MKKCKFVLKLKGSQEYLKRIHDGIWFTTDDINSALKWECNTDLSMLKVDEDKYEVFKV